MCRSCHLCHVAGKPNQLVPLAPVCPIPMMGGLFEWVIVDCMGPLPKTKSGNEFLLTVMCASTRFPEAVPLQKITAKVISKALEKKKNQCLVYLRLSRLIRAQIFTSKARVH